MQHSTVSRIGHFRLWIGLLSMLLLWGLQATSVYAVQFEGGNQYELTLGETVSEDLFVAGNSVVISGTIDGDLFAAGQTIRIDGVVTGHVFAAANLILVTGEVQGDLYAAAETVIVEGTVGKDLRVAAGGESQFSRDFVNFIPDEANLDADLMQLMSGPSGVVVAPEARIGGDTLAAGADVELSGTFGSDIQVFGGKIALADTITVSGDVTGEAGEHFEVAGRVEGGVDIKSSEFEFDPSLSIGGKLAYGTHEPDPQAPALAEFYLWDPEAENGEQNTGRSWRTWIFRTLTVLVGSVLLVFLSIRVGQTNWDNAAYQIRTQAGMAVVWGVVSLLGVPILLLLLPFIGYLFFGIPIAIMIWAVLMLAWMFFWVFSPLITGRTLGGVLGGVLPEEQVAWPNILAGVLILVLIARLVFLPSGAGLPGIVNGIASAVSIVVIVLSYILAVGGWVQSWGRGGQRPASNAIE